jgi:hypothetical protein
MIPVHFTTGTSTPALTLLNGGKNCGVMGAVSNNVETSTTIYLKFWWQKNLANPPTIGTTAPDLTIPITSAVGLVPFSFYRPVNPGGPCWYAVTKNGGDTDDTALSTGGEVVTIFIE